MTCARIGLLLSCLLATSTTACSGPEGQSSDNLTSNTARQRQLVFEGYVYVGPDASDDEILDRVHEQTQSMFGPLVNAEIGVNKRELQGVDPATFVRTPLTEFETADPQDGGRPVVRVRYRYEDVAVVPKSYADRSAINLSLLSPGYQAQSERILGECTSNDSHARDFATSVWYVFDPSRSSCRAAITAEQQEVDAANALLDDPTTQVSRAETQRLYLPTTVALGADTTNDAPSYPEYHRLFSGGVEQDTLVIALVNGLLDHDHDDGLINDFGYREWMRQLREAMASGPRYRITASDPPVDLSSFTVDGTTVDGATIDDLLAWELDGTMPAGVYDRNALRRAVGDKLIQRWITLEAPVKVSLGGEPARDFTIKINTYFGSGSDATPHKRGIRTSDVFIYNGHSYIGYGPLDPSRFTAADFPASYQLLFIDGCVSYNYYEADYFPLKQGGSKNLDIITNGLEAPSWQAGYALGRFLNRMLDGTSASYADLLREAEMTDELRVVDGELDNEFAPADQSLTVSW
jgi:hypothetical protein